ncbi:MAG TPA: tetratricopeptide repeat protein [Methanothrix sp.]|nr:tetratricopeptide repeat protein [Methanothrix sp.]
MEWVDVKRKTVSAAALNGLSKLGVVTWLAIILGILALLSTSVTAQEMTSEDWYKKGQEMYENGSYQEALEAYDEVLKIDSQNASAWHYRGMALVSMGRGVEANQSLQKAIELLDQMLQEDPKDPEALWLRAEGMDLLGVSEEALEAYGRVEELNSSNAMAAWIRESDILAAFGRYNQSTEAFSRAMALFSANQSQLQLECQWQRENASIFTKAWIIDGQIHRVSIGMYNISSGSFDEIQQINSDFVAALQLKGVAVNSGRHGGNFTGSSLNWDMYIFGLPTMTALDRPPATVIITAINPKGDEFIEVTNDMKETVSLQNWSFEILGSTVMLPQQSILSGKAVRFHLGSGQGNETDLFLDCDLELNDTAGNATLRNDSGEKVSSLDYRTRLDGSIATSLTIFEHPRSDAEATAQNAEEQKIGGG